MGNNKEKTSVYIIAEAGVNHNGDFKIAKKLVDIAAEAGVDAVKFQIFKTKNIITRTAVKADYQTLQTQSDDSQFNMLQELELSFDEHRKIFEYCRDKSVHYLCSAFDEESLDFIAELPVSMFKISSGEITNLPFLRKIAEKRKPIILSTGMSTMAEIETAVQEIYQVYPECDLTLLHCVSNYPAPPESINLNAMQTLAETVKTRIGFSDHTLGNEIAFAAVAMGAEIIEKHFTLDKNFPGPDHQASIDGTELKKLVSGIRKIEQAMGNGDKKLTEAEIKISTVVRKSLVAAKNIRKGEKIVKDMICIKRPGTGMPPVMIDKLPEKTALINIAEDQVLTEDMFE